MTWEVERIDVEGRSEISLALDGNWEPFAVDRGVMFVRRLIPETELSVKPSMMRCEVCGRQIESDEWLDLGQLRFRKNLCRRHFEAMRDRK